jgi:acetoin utilization deacetylase AcuC-like enzyme
MNFVLRVHDDAYIERLRKACADGKPYIDVPDSAICPASFEIARVAVGSVVNAVDAVMDQSVDNAFCAVRPPGHHAERGVSLGFCLLNNVAIAAAHLIEDHGMSRVVILDWDVHHGNGTQHAFESDARVLFISLHGHPGVVYPGTGYVTEHGTGEGEGFTINVPMIPSSGDAAYRRAFDETILPAVGRFRPEFVLISAGFDAHVRDPLAPLELSTAMYGWMTDRMVEVAREHCGGRLVSVLEGGYDLEALGECSFLHVARLLEA